MPVPRGVEMREGLTDPVATGPATSAGRDRRECSRPFSASSVPPGGLYS